MLYSDCKAWMAVPSIGIAACGRRERRRAPRRGKRVDTNGFYPLNSHFLLFLSLAQTRDRRPLRKRERQRIFSSVGEHSVLPFLYLCAVPDTLLLHIPATLRRRNITVLRNSFARCYGRHLRIVSDVRLYRRVRRLGAPFVYHLHMIIP